MQSGINIEDVKKYNASLREYREKSSKLRAEIEFNQQELAKQCAELSKTLGIEVTPENVKTILEERVAKINNTMAIGNEILARIKSEEATAVSGHATPTVGFGVNGVNMGQPTVAQYGNVQSNSAHQAPVAPGIDVSGGLPPIFANPSRSIEI